MPSRTVRLRCEVLEGRDVPAIFAVPNLYSVQAIEVDPVGIISGVGTTLSPSELRVGEFFTLTPDGVYTQQQLGGGDFTVSSVVPKNLRNGRAVGWASVYTADTSVLTERALGWDLSNPGTAYELGHAVAPGYPFYADYTQAYGLNASGAWAGSSGAGILAVTGQLFDASTFTIVPTPPGSLAFANDIADNGTVVLTVTPYATDRIDAWVVKPDGTATVLRNPFAPDPTGYSEMFGWRISEDGSTILCNASTYNPDRETNDFVPVVFSGPDFSQWAVVPDARGGPYFGLAEDVENSGLVSIQSAEGIVLWKPGMTAPRTINDLAAPADTLPSRYPYFVANTVAYHPQNPVQEIGGRTYVAFQTDTLLGTDCYVLRLDGIVGNQPPVVPSKALVADEDQPLPLDLLDGATDADGDALSVTAVTPPAHGTITWAADGTATYRPAADYNGPDAFDYTVTDGTASALGHVAVTVQPVNDPPVAAADAARTTRDQAVTGSLLANDTDVDGDLLTVVGNTTPANGQVVVLPTGAFTYTPRAGFVGTDSFSYTVGDGRGGTASAVATVTVAPANRAPVAVPDVVTIRGGAPLTFTPFGNDRDPDGDPLTIATASAPAHGTITWTADGQVTYIPRAGFTGVDTFTYTVSDGRGGTATGRVTVIVLPRLPVARTTVLTPSGMDVGRWLDDILAGVASVTPGRV